MFVALGVVLSGLAEGEARMDFRVGMLADIYCHVP